MSERVSNISVVIDSLEGDLESFDKHERYILSHDGYTSFHTIRYSNIIKREYGISSYLATFYKENVICGLVILYNCPVFPLGKKFTDLLFSGSYGGLLCNKDVLKQSLIKVLKQELKTHFLTELKLTKRDVKHITHDATSIYVNYKLSLYESIDNIWTDKVDQKARNQVRKASKSGLQFSLHGIEGVEEFYDVYKKTMKGLGSPAMSLEFFKCFAVEFSEEVKISIVKYNDTPISALFNILTEKRIHNVWAGSLFEYRRYCPNYMNYWELIKWSKDNNINEFDFGRSIVNSTHESFKKQWGAQKIELYYYDVLRNRHSYTIDTKSKAVLLFTRIWRSSPCIFTNIFNNFFLKRTG
jgi:serine/alanine adding enzyme